MQPTYCTYCNTVIVDLKATHCPRCGEKTKRIHSAEPVVVVDPLKQLEKISSLSPDAVIKSKQPEWFPVAFFISCILAMVVLFLGIWWASENKDKVKDKESEQKKLSTVGPATQTPWNMTTIRYLPTTENIVSGLQTQPLLEYAKRLNQDPKQLFNEIGIPDVAFEFLSQTGINMDDISEVAAGLELLPDNAIPEVDLVIFFKNKIENPNELIAKVEANKTIKLFKVYAKVVDFKVLLVTTNTRRFVETAHVLGAEDFSRHMTDTMKKQLSPSTWAWVVTDQMDWSEKPTIKALFLFNKITQADQEIFSKGRSAVAGLSFEPEFNVGIAVQTSEEAKSRALENFLTQKGAGYPCLIGRNENWTTFDLAATPKEMKKIITSFFTK